ncbi:MAG: hypothetical protein WKG06_41855 [Segetibacter sp.]
MICSICIFATRIKIICNRLGGSTTEEKTKTLNFEDYRQASEKLLDYFENNGYPFAKINLDSISISNKSNRSGFKY